MSETPETEKCLFRYDDGAGAVMTVGGHEIVTADFARRLERERDALKAELNALYSGKSAVIPHTKEHAEQLLIVAEACLKTFNELNK